MDGIAFTENTDTILTLIMNAPRQDQAGPMDIATRESAVSLREWTWLALIAAALLATYLSPLGEHLTHVAELRQDLERLGPLAPLVFILAMTGLTAAGIPRMAMYPLAGLAFGFLPGLLWSMVATVAGAYATFLYARWAGRSLVMKKWPALARLSSRLDARGFLSVALIRQLPSPGFLTNLMFGISAVRPTCFLLGTVLGSLPSAIPATMLGSSLSNASDGQRIRMAIAALAAMAVLGLVIAWMLRRHGLLAGRKQNTPGEPGVLRSPDEPAT